MSTELSHAAAHAQTPQGRSAADGGAAPETEGVSFEVRNLTKWYGSVHALSGVSFSVGRGEILGLIGDNGAGKSTLVKIVSGVVRPDEGEILVDGEEVAIHSPKEARALGIETVHQDLSLVNTMDVTSNLFLNREIVRGKGPFKLLGWLNSKKMHEEAKNILNTLHINIPSVRYPVGQLSGGQRQAVAVGRSVAWGKRIVLMDEPAAALGVEQSRVVLNLVERLADEDVLVVLISHNMQQVLQVCTRVVVLRHGSVVADMPMDGVTARDLVDLITGAK